MNVNESEHWITGKELAQQRNELLDAGFRHDSPEFIYLRDRVAARDRFIWDTFSEPLLEFHSRMWAAISIDGESIVETSAPNVLADATVKFGPGNFAYGRLAEYHVPFLKG